MCDGRQAVCDPGPTTILAWQHFNTAMARMEAFPIRIGLLSRYRSAREQKETLRGLRDGTVDIVVGTHRLLSDDVKFRDLGLVISTRNSGSASNTRKSSRKPSSGSMC